MKQHKSNYTYQDILIKSASKLGIKLTILQAQTLLKYLELLRKWNTTYNLCANADFFKMLTYHLLDSLSIAAYTNCFNKLILDVGSGAGLPGIPLAILAVAKHITLLDSRNKRTVFVNYVINELQLKNINVELIRVEKYVPSIKFDLIISRAFGNLQTLVASTVRLLATQIGEIITMKSDPEKFALNAQVIPGYIISEIKSFKIPGIKNNRSLITVKKALK